MKGTGFLLSTGLMVTNNHVVEGCTKDDMKANPFSPSEFGFTKMAVDKTKDLALLHPDKVLKGGLEIAATDTDPDLETSVETFGFPLTYNGPAPLLSAGYVAGYVKDGDDGKEVKHIVVNGAFNPGNSGGPLLRRRDNTVIGVVVAKFHLYPPFVEKIIDGLNKETSGLMHGLLDASGKQIMGANGQPIQFSEGQLVGAVLEQFYKTTQVMIGEAISVSELRSFIKEKRSEVE
jgi:S1-C subfamily serine protease